MGSRCILVVLKRRDGQVLALRSVLVGFSSVLARFG